MLLKKLTPTPRPYKPVVASLHSTITGTMTHFSRLSANCFLSRSGLLIDPGVRDSDFCSGVPHSQAQAGLGSGGGEGLSRPPCPPYGNSSFAKHRANQEGPQGSGGKKTEASPALAAAISAVAMGRHTAVSTSIPTFQRAVRRAPRSPSHTAWATLAQRLQGTLPGRGYPRSYAVLRP